MGDNSPTDLKRNTLKHYGDSVNGIVTVLGFTVLPINAWKSLLEIEIPNTLLPVEFQVHRNDVCKTLKCFHLGTLADSLNYDGVQTQALLDKCENYYMNMKQEKLNRLNDEAFIQVLSEAMTSGG